MYKIYLLLSQLGLALYNCPIPALISLIQKSEEVLLRLHL